MSRRRYTPNARHTADNAALIRPTKLASLDTRLPLRDYLVEQYGQEWLAKDDRDRQTAARGLPLVSIIVRSMGRPELRHALESLAKQDYPALEVIVVDATGGKHPPVPEITWRTGHRLRMVGSDKPLPRANAANAGLTAIQGEWFGFLDDDDTFDPDHVSELMHAAMATENLVVYGNTREVGPDGETRSVMGLPFNRALMYSRPIFSFQAALAKRSVIDLGCRFDECMVVCENQDFFTQIACHSEFTKIDLATFNFNVELGTSGTGQGANWNNVSRFHRFRQLMLAKWAGDGGAHIVRAARFNRKAHDAYAGGDPDLARSIFESALREYMDEPNLLCGYGQLASNTGDHDRAISALRRAVAVDPGAGYYRLALAAHLERIGDRKGARREAMSATSDEKVRKAANLMLDRLGRPPATPQQSRAEPSSTLMQPSRAGPCPCGSGKRYKHCCGREGAVAPGAATIHSAEAKAQQAISAYRIGEASMAMGMLSDLSLDDLSNVDTVLACGDICQEMANYEKAFEFIRRAECLGDKERFTAAVILCCKRWYTSIRNASLRGMQRDQIARLQTGHGSIHGQQAAIHGNMHIIASLGAIDGPAQQAISLFATLSPSPHMPVRLWSVVTPMVEYASRYPIETLSTSQDRFPQ